jgi:hypothetical protein
MWLSTGATMPSHAKTTLMLTLPRLTQTLPRVVLARHARPARNVRDA